MCKDRLRLILALKKVRGYPKEHVIDDRPENDTVCPGSDVSGKCSTFFEDTHGHHRFFDEIILNNPESDESKDSENKRDDDIGRFPWE